MIIYSHLVRRQKRRSMKALIFVSFQIGVLFLKKTNFTCKKDKDGCCRPVQQRATSAIDLVRDLIPGIRLHCSTSIHSTVTGTRCPSSLSPSPPPPSTLPSPLFLPPSTLLKFHPRYLVVAGISLPLSSLTPVLFQDKNQNVPKTNAVAFIHLFSTPTFIKR